MLPPGTYRILASKAGLATRVIDAVQVSGPGKPEAENVRIDMEAGLRVDVHVTDGDGDGVRIGLTARAVDGKPFLGLSSGGTVVTDAGGRGSLDTLPAKPLVISTVAKPGFKTLEWEVDGNPGDHVEVDGVLLPVEKTTVEGS